MDALPGTAIIISLLMAIVLATCPAAGEFSFPADGSVVADVVVGVPVLPENVIQASIKTVDESFDGKTVRVADGDILLVQLNERDPDQIWHFSDGDGFKVVSDVVREMYPARHDFRVRVSRPGDLRFTKIDRRDGYVIDTFKVRVVLDKVKSGNNSRIPHPLRMLQSMGPDMGVCPFWR